MASHSSDEQAPQGPISSVNIVDPASIHIEELQSHFGSILLSDKYKPEIPIQDGLPSDIAAILFSEKYRPIIPAIKHSEGPISFLSFPRELRDDIYFHYLYRPKHVVYQHSRARHQIPSVKGKERNPLSLYLTSRQVYGEALQVFCRHNTIEIISRQTRKVNFLPGTLRLFPDRPARLLHQIARHYNAWSWRPWPEWPFRSRDIGKQWAGIVAEAGLCKEYFPMLREFTAQWTVPTDVFSFGEFDDYQNTPEQKVEIWLRWLRQWAKEWNVVPGPWLKFELHIIDSGVERASQTSELNTAYACIWREQKILEHEAENIEESGRKWLEETWGEGSAEGRKQHVNGSEYMRRSRNNKGQARLFNYR